MIDNYDLYEIHEAQQEGMIKRLPVCEICGEPIMDDYLYDLNGEIWCEECLKNEFRKDAEYYMKGN